MSSQDERARRLFEAFHDRSPQGNELVSLQIVQPLPLLQVGRCWAISYKLREGGKPLFHKFEAQNRPLLYVSADGTEFFGFKGNWKFTDRGFVG